MPFYITDTTFFSDAHDIGTEYPQSTKGFCSVQKSLPDTLTLTRSLMPSDISRKRPAFFLLNDDPGDQDGLRFSYLFDRLKDKDFALFHFLIGSDPQSQRASVFASQMNSLLRQYPFLDEDQLYIGGFGHGVSHMLAITGQDHCFRAAVSLNAFVNYTTAYGNYEGCHEDFLQSGQPDLASWLYAMAEQCPLKYLDQNRTPYLILHSHRDRICPEEQSEELFSAIKDRIPKVPCRMIIFPDENHQILLPGHEKYQERIANEILQWFLKFQEDSIC